MSDERPADWKSDQIARYRNATADTVIYDFFKSLTALCMLTLGGVLSLSTTVFADVLTTRQMFLAVALIALSGIVSFQCEADIAQISSGRDRASIWLRFGHRVAPGLYGAGIGIFLFMLASAML